MSDDRISINTTLDPVTHGVLAALAARDTPGRAHANVTISRLVKEELDRTNPGAWDALVYKADLPGNVNLDPRELSANLAAHLAGIFRGRANPT